MSDVRWVWWPGASVRHAVRASGWDSGAVCGQPRPLRNRELNQTYGSPAQCKRCLRKLGGEA
jgi:hypothetical protein